MKNFRFAAIKQRGFITHVGAPCLYSEERPQIEEQARSGSGTGVRVGARLGQKHPPPSTTIPPPPARAKWMSRVYSKAPKTNRSTCTSSPCWRANEWTSQNDMTQVGPLIGNEKTLRANLWTNNRYLASRVKFSRNHSAFHCAFETSLSHVLYTVVSSDSDSQNSWQRTKYSALVNDGVCRGIGVQYLDRSSPGDVALTHHHPGTDVHRVDLRRTKKKKKEKERERKEGRLVIVKLKEV